MEQTKNEPKNENKAAPVTASRKRSAKPLTEAQRLKRQKMIVLPAMVLVFIGAMWLIFAPSSGKEQSREQAATTSRCPMRTRRTARLSVTSESLRAGEMEERQENRSRAMRQLGDMFDRETAAADRDSDFDLANPGGTEEAEKARTEDHPVLRSRLPRPQCHARQLLRAAEKRQCGDGRTAGTHRHARIGTGKREERSSTMDEQVALMEKSYELAAKYMGDQNGTRRQRNRPQSRPPCRKPERTRQNP